MDAQVDLCFRCPHKPENMFSHGAAYNEKNVYTGGLFVFSMTFQ